ncbi:MAG: hypothetical protein LBI69_00250 [Puniceicoccales bacterium]|jgi:hypothetical protein|nr:hypothetical protein [Puniceicoccales bacterium]
MSKLPGAFLVIQFFLLAVAVPIYGREKALAISDVHIVRACDGDFCRLLSYFSAESLPYRHTIVRTQEEQWDGTYFIIFFSEKLKNLRWKRLEVLLSYYVANDPKIYVLRFPLGKVNFRTKELWIGLTDSIWRSHFPREFLAWKVLLLDGDRAIACRKSFLFPN